MYFNFNNCFYVEFEMYLTSGSGMVHSFNIFLLLFHFNNCVYVQAEMYFTDHIRMYLGSRCAMQCRISITYKSSYSSCSSGPNFSSTCKLSPRYIYIYIY